MNYQTLIEEYRPYWLSVARRITGSIEDAEDAVQNALMKWWMNDNGQIEHVKTYVTRAVINQSLNLKEWLGIRQTEALPDIEPALNSTEAQLSEYDLELTQWLNQLSLKLSPTEQGILLLKDVLQFSYDDIGEFYNRNADHCRQTMHRAKKHLAINKVRFTTPSWDLSELKRCLIEAVERGVSTPLLDFLQKPQFF